MSHDKPYPAHPAGTKAAASLASVISSARSIKDPLQRAQATTDILQSVTDAAQELREIRSDAVIEVNESGMGYGKIADALGISKVRVQQILDAIGRTPRMGRVEITARTEAARLRERRASDEVVVDTLVPKLIAIRSAERYEPAAIAEMLDVPVAAVRGPWSKARREKEKNKR